ncbi:MAG: mechanosensitive ion channel [Victivallales bacterium]|nr:mechanosensitive ion channel [Victivallales bacterium]
MPNFPDIHPTIVLHSSQSWLSLHWPQLLLALGILVGCLAALWLLRSLLTRLGKHLDAQKPGNLPAQLCTSVIRPVTWIGLLVGIRLSLTILPITSPIALLWIDRGFICVIAIVLAIGINFLLNTFCKWLIQHETQAQKAQQVLMTDLIRRLLMALLWFLTFFFLLQNVFSLNVSALLAGAGVIGLALAFAAQNTVANLFGAVSLIGDSPFKIGDWVKIGDQEGLVEAIGLRSMRLRAFTGELLVIPNRIAADAVIINNTDRKHIRQTLNIGVTYSTSPEKMREAMDIIKEILDSRPICNKVRPPIIVFNEMKDWSLNIMVIIWFGTSDLAQKNAELSELHLQILERFNQAGIDFAFPSNTTYLVNQK